MLPRTLKRSPSRELLMHAGGRQTGPIVSICEDDPFAAARRAAYLAGRSLADAPTQPLRPKNHETLRTEWTATQPENPILACIHDASTNRIFAFRRDSYIPVDSEHFPQDESPRFIACPDITRCEQLFYNDEVGMQRSADARFRLLSEAARVLRGQLQGATQTED